MEELQKLQEKIDSILGKIKTATEMISGWTRTENLIIETHRRNYIYGFQEQILVLCQATNELPHLVRGYILLTTEYVEVIKDFEEAISRYYQELLEEEA